MSTGACWNYNEMSLSIFEIFTGKHRGPSQIFLGKHLDVQLESWNGFTNISTLKLNKFKPSTDCSPHLHFFLFLMPRKFLIFISRLGALQHTDASWRHLIIVGLFIAAVGGRHHFTVSIWCLHTVYESSIQEPTNKPRGALSILVFHELHNQNIFSTHRGLF